MSRRISTTSTTRNEERRISRVDSSRVNSASCGNEGGNNNSKEDCCGRRLVKYEELPEFLKDNEYILDYYRCEWPLKDTFLSVFSWHNETLNIWTHLGGFIIFATMAVATLMENANNKDNQGSISSFLRTNVVATPLMTILALHSYNSSMNAATRHNYLTKMKGSSHGSTLELEKPRLLVLTDVDKDTQYRHFSKPSSLMGFDTADSALLPKWPWFVFLGGAMCCLVFSSISHLLACHSKRLNLFFWRLDYTGISIMIVSSFFAPIYYAFYCQPVWKLLYLTSITIFGILSIITLLAPALSSPRFRKFRASLFLTMGFSGVIPAVHAAIVHRAHPQMLIALGYEVFMGMLYATGAGFYVSRVPERWRPGAFDLAGHSHQIFHVFVVGGALAHSVATLIMMSWRQGSQTC
ncbi:hypothetical protein KSS87_021411 [Heliosperma pusillum]|nr:hypothetical protein KSS87_021411 [Heliosperma pusillum]